MMKLLSLTLLVGLALIGGSAQAQALDAQVQVNGSASTGSSGAGVSSDTSVDVDADTADSSNGNAETGNDTSASGTLNTGADIGFNILRGEMDDSAEYSVTNAASVRTSASLESYAAATVRADERLDSVEIQEGQLDIKYRKPAKFLWIIPASVTAHVTVDQEGEVTARYPWYAFLFSTDETRAALETEIRNEVKSITDSGEVSARAEVAGSASAGVQGDAMIRRWARIIEAAYIALSGDARVDASARVSS